MIIIHYYSFVSLDLSCGVRARGVSARGVAARGAGRRGPRGVWGAAGVRGRATSGFQKLESDLRFCD